MKKINQLLTLAVAAFFIGQASALAAEMVHAQIKSISPTENKLTVQKIDQQGALGQEVELTVPQDAQLQGVQRLNELSVGDEIRYEANQNLFGPSEVQRLEKASGSSQIGQTGQEKSQQGSEGGWLGGSEEKSQGAQSQQGQSSGEQQAGGMGTQY